MVDKIGVLGLADDVFRVFVTSKANTITLTDSTLTLSNTYSGTIIYCKNTVTNTLITLDPSAQTGVSITLVQGSNTKNVRVSTTGSGTILNKNGYRNTAGYGAAVSVSVLENITGANATWLFVGDAI